MPDNNKSIDEDIEVITSELDDNTLLVTTSEKGKKWLETAMYNFENKDHIFSKYLNNVGDTDLNITLDKVNQLALNPQDDIEKIKQINNYIRFYINKDDLTGKVYETIENNINTEIKLSYPEIKGRNKSKSRERASEVITSFNENINTDSLLKKSISTTYSEGNYVMYLRGEKGNYVVDYYPLGVVEITDYEIDGEPVVVMNVNELKSRLQTVGFKDKKGKGLFMTTIEEQIQKNYPPEVYEAYVAKEKYAVLNPERSGVVRVNNLNRRYGVTSIFKTLPAQIMLDIIEISDKKNTSAKGKKIIAQLLRKELLGDKGSNTQHFGELSYAHNNFIQAWKNDIVIVTCPAYVEDVKYVEPKAEPTNINTINFYRTKILTALGISFLSNESKSSYTTSEININELMKTINKISSQVEKILKKYYKLILQDNGLIEYTPNVKIIDSELMDTELKLKLADVVFSKLGGSYRTSYEIMGLDYNTEKQRRIEENDEKVDEIFKAHITAYTNSAKNVDSNNDKKVENQNVDKEKQANDKARYEKDLKNIQ